MEYPEKIFDNVFNTYFKNIKEFEMLWVFSRVDQNRKKTYFLRIGWIGCSILLVAQKPLWYSNCFHIFAIFPIKYIKLIYSVKASKFCEISIVDTVKSTMEISLNFVIFSELKYINFMKKLSNVRENFHVFHDTINLMWTAFPWQS